VSKTDPTTREQSPYPVYGLPSPEVDRPHPGVRRYSHSSSNVTIAAYSFEPGARFPTHHHPEEQITVVLEGDVEFVVGSQTHHLGAGETVVVEPGVEHSLRAGDAGARFVAVVLPRRSNRDAYTITR
jgi:quercetin dioxygenase-like cupin family protein